MFFQHVPQNLETRGIAWEQAQSLRKWPAGKSIPCPTECPQQRWVAVQTLLRDTAPSFPHSAAGFGLSSFLFMACVSHEDYWNLPWYKCLFFLQWVPASTFIPALASVLRLLSFLALGLLMTWVTDTLTNGCNVKWRKSVPCVQLERPLCHSDMLPWSYWLCLSALIAAPALGGLPPVGQDSGESQKPCRASISWLPF